MPIGDGRKVVAAAGTAEKLSSTSVAVQSVTVAAATDNTGAVVVGGPSVVADEATRRGIPLEAGAIVSLKLTARDDDVDDLAQVWVDAETDGDGVTYLYSTEG